MLNPKARSGLALLCALSLVLAGCGGGGRNASSSSAPTASRTAALRLKMVWPYVTSRMVPNAANSVVAIVTVNGTEVARSLFTRPIDNRGPADAGSTTTLLSALPAGTAQVTYTAYPNPDGSGTAQAKGSATETLVAGQTTEDTASMASTVSELSLELSPPSVYVGRATSPHVSAKDADGATVLLQTRYYDAEDLTWSSSDESVARDDGQGAFVALAVGTTELKASMVVDDAGNKKTASATLTVTAAPISTLGVQIDGARSVTAGSAIELTASATMSDQTIRNVTSEATWSSSDPSVATVDAAGRVTGMAAGNATISATYGGREGTYPVSVQPARTLRIVTISPDLDQMEYSSSQQFTATANYTDDSTQDVTSETTWTSSDPSVISITADGLAHAENGGTAHIRANWKGETADLIVHVYL